MLLWKSGQRSLRKPNIRPRYLVPGSEKAFEFRFMGGTLMDKYKVVFHIDEQVKASLVLHNISNLITDLGGENLEIEMVANGDAVKVLARSADESRPMLIELVEKQVAFSACANAMRNLGIQKDELFDFVTVVSSGVGEIVKKQTAGWAYIRP